MPSAARLPDALIERLRDVRSVGAITGAGVSSESGIQTYRGRGGIYDDPVEGDETVEALSGGTLATDPDRTWRALAKLARQAAGARPGRAHRALVDIEERVERFVLLTQNVDGLHQAAGSRNVIDLHGDVSSTVCRTCGTTGHLDPAEIAALDAAPRCAGCRGVVRPRVVLFGELLPVEKVARMQDEFHGHPPDLVMTVGTTALFPYIVEPLVVARRAGRLTVEINPEATDSSPFAEFCLRGPASTYLPLVADALGTSPDRRS